MGNKLMSMGGGEIMFEGIPTAVLVDELRKRPGVSSQDVGPYEKYEISGTGPAVILIIED